MDFKVVEIPGAQPSGFTGQVVNVMQENIGKAIEVPFENREPNALRKMIRSTVANRGLLRKNFFRSKAAMERNVLIVWLEPKPNQDPLAEAIRNTQQAIAAEMPESRGLRTVEEQEG